MKSAPSSPLIFSSPNLLWIGIGLAILYWFLESMMHLFVFKDGEFISQLLAPDAHEIWKRMLVAALVIAFSIYAQYSINIRRRTEAALAEREQDLSMILENNPAGIMLVDADTRTISWANSKALKMVNSERENVERHICHNHLCLTETEACPILDSGKNVESSEHILQTSEGERLPILKSVTRVKYNGREHLLEAFFDISDRKKLEQDLRLAHAELDQIFQTASVAMRLIGLDFRILKINKTFGQLAEVSEAAAVGRKCYEVFPGPSCNTAICSLQRILSGKESVECYIEKHRPDGAKIPCILTATPFVGPDGQVMGIVESFLDISLQKRAQDAVESERDKLNRILSHLHEGVSIINSDYLVEYHNDVFRKYFGDCEGKLCYVGIHGREAPCVPCIMDKAVQTGHAVKHIEFKTADGRSLEKSYAPVKDIGNQIKVVGLWRDVTEQNAATAAIVRAEQLAALGELAAGVAHEINNPINGIINYAQIVFNRSGANSLLREIAGRMIKEGDRIARIVEGLLSFTRSRDEEKVCISIVDVLNDSIMLLGAQLRRENIILKISLPKDLPRIFAQGNEIEQVFVNLISNARHALNQKYPEVHEDKILEIKADVMKSNGCEYVRVGIRDHGTGISPDIIDKVKNPFFSTKTEKNRTGLGLSISNAIISKHKGDLYLKSDYGHFTEVILVIPCFEEYVSETVPAAQLRN